MRPLVLIVFATLACGASAGIAAAQTEPTTMGCGSSRTRDAAGRCHHPFNRFNRHHQFQAYKRSHCRPIHTPSGTVGFCKI